MTHSTPLSTTTPVDPSSPYFNCGSFSRKITTSSPAAQIWFNRGLFWCYSFNHDEAVRCFLQSTLHDINCSMAWWGIAYALGANYNKPWELFNNLEEDLVRISYALDMAKKAIHKDHLENALIKSIDSRMPGDISNREFNFWEKRYMYSMREIYNDHHNDLDVVAFYAEAMMNQTPWQLWDLQTGEPAPGSHAIEIERILETALALPGGDSHPGLLHFYIHTEELSQHPEKAVVPGDKLIRVAGDAGHLLHMPSHLDILIGDYRRSINANALAIDADIKYCEKEGYTGFFMIYLFHDFDSLIYATMFNGQFEVAMKYVKWEQSIFTDSLIDTHGDYLEASAANKIHVLVRFGRWEDLIALELPKDQKRYSITTTMIHYGKGVAYAATGLVEEALEQRRLFLEAKNNVPAARMFFPNKASDVLDIAAAMLDGEIEYRRKNYEVAFAHLAKSIELYDGLIYAEPWGWMQPTRHPYAALLLEQGHVEKALAIYAADLGLDGILPRSFQHPNNVWALHGYYECLIKLGRHEEAKQIKPQLTLALAVADVKIESSCFCRLETVIIENIEQKLGKSCCK